MRIVAYTLAALVAVSTPALARVTPAQAQAEVCGIVGQMAKLVMSARQKNTSLASMMEMVESMEQKPSTREGAGFLRPLIYMAYNHPAVPGAKAKQKAISAFVKKTTRTCFKK